jgi:hypothetical protein
MGQERIWWLINRQYPSGFPENPHGIGNFSSFVYGFGISLLSWRKKTDGFFQRGPTYLARRSSRRAIPPRYPA